MAGIDRDFWLDFAKDAASKNIEVRELAADKINTFLEWVWNIYTLLFAIGSLFEIFGTDLLRLILVSQPILIIMLARYCCLLVTMPSSLKANPNNISKIIEGYMLVVNAKAKKLNNALIATVISMISICIALIAYNVLEPNKDLKKELVQRKLLKELHENTIVVPSVRQGINDSIKQESDFYEYKNQLYINYRRSQLLQSNDTTGINNLKKLNINMLN